MPQAPPSRPRSENFDGSAASEKGSEIPSYRRGNCAKDHRTWPSLHRRLNRLLHLDRRPIHSEISGSHVASSFRCCWNGSPSRRKPNLARSHRQCDLPECENLLADVGGDRWVSDLLAYA